MTKITKIATVISLAITLSPSAWAIGNIRTHYSLEHESNEVGAEYKISPTSKIGLIGESLAGSTDLKYSYTYVATPKIYITPTVGYFAYNSTNALTPGFEDIAYARLNLTYAPIKQLALYAEYTDSMAVQDVDLGEIVQYRAGAVIKPIDELKLIYRYAQQEYVNFFGIETEKHEYWLSYGFSNGLEPYIFAIDQKDANLNLNLGLQYNF